MWLRSALPGIALLVGLASASCDDTAAEDELVVFAAASLRDVVAQVGERFEESHGARVRFNFAGSNVLAQQLGAGAKADLFLSADERWIDFVEERGCTIPGTRRRYLRNRLVVVARPDSFVFEDLGAHGGPVLDRSADLATAPYDSLVLADPDAVPAGRYAREWLERVTLDSGRTLWDALASRVVPTADARAAVALVESDPRLVGVVYATDERRSEKVRALFAPEDQPDIVYGAVRVARAGRASNEAADSLLGFLFGEGARTVYAAHGFALADDDLGR